MKYVLNKLYYKTSKILMLKKHNKKRKKCHDDRKKYVLYKFYFKTSKMCDVKRIMTLG